MKKKALINYIKKPVNDEFYTPPEAVYPLLPYLPKDKIYWECSDFGESNITRVLKEHGFKVISTGKLKDGFDFLLHKPDFEFDVIITNPPFSLKNEFLKRAYSFKKPFAFLLPITALEGKERGQLFKRYGIEVLVLDRRINFMTEKKAVWFNSSWFCWKILPEKLMFASVEDFSSLFGNGKLF